MRSGGWSRDFGKGDIGKMPVIRTLATMAHDCRRTELFQGELLAALKIVQRGDLPLRDLIGAFAGEIGQTQFLPSSYIKYGVDFDGNGHVDLRHSVPDVLASTANLLHISGFKGGAPYGEGTANFEAMREWNRAMIYRKTIGYFADSWWGAEASRVQAGAPLARACIARCVHNESQCASSRPRSRDPYAAASRFGTGVRDLLSTTTAAAYGSRRSPGRHPTGRATPSLTSPPSPAIFSIRFASTAQYVAGRNRCSRSRKPRVVADQDARLVFLDAGDDALGGGRRRGLGHRIEAVDRFRAARVVGDAGAGAGIAHDVGQHAAGMHHRQFHRAVRHRELMPQAFGKSAHREFRRAIGGLAGRGDDAEDRGEVDDMRLAASAKAAAGRRACRAPRPRN